MHRLCKVIRLSLNNIRAYWHRVPLQVMYLEYTVLLCSVLVKGNWHGSIHEKTIRIIQNMEHSTKLAWILQTWNMRDQEKKAEGLLILGEIGQWQPNAKHKWLDLGFKKKKKKQLQSVFGDNWWYLNGLCVRLYYWINEGCDNIVTEAEIVFILRMYML